MIFFRARILYDNFSRENASLSKVQPFFASCNVTNVRMSRVTKLKRCWVPSSGRLTSEDVNNFLLKFASCFQSYKLALFSVQLHLIYFQNYKLALFSVSTSPPAVLPSTSCEDDLWKCIDDVTANAFSQAQNKVSKQDNIHMMFVGLLKGFFKKISCFVMLCHTDK